MLGLTEKFQVATECSTVPAVVAPPTCHNDIILSVPGFSCKANVRRRNAAGQTAYDVAASSGCGSMASLLAAQTGLDLLGKLGIMNSR